MPHATRTKQPAARARARRYSLPRWCAIGLLCVVPAVATAQANESNSTAHASARVNRLKVGTLVEFDTHKGTVGDAIGYLLEPVHYRLTTRTVDPMASAGILRRPIPPIAARSGVMSIESALLLLIGDDHRLVVDHVHRLIAIERMPAMPIAQQP